MRQHTREDFNAEEALKALELWRIGGACSIGQGAPRDDRGARPPSPQCAQKAIPPVGGMACAFGCYMECLLRIPSPGRRCTRRLNSVIAAGQQRRANGSGRGRVVVHEVVVGHANDRAAHRSAKPRAVERNDRADDVELGIGRVGKSACRVAAELRVADGGTCVPGRQGDTGICHPGN